jgi:hypothetical protein
MLLLQTGQGFCKEADVGVEPAQVIDTRFGLLKLQQGLKLMQ